MRPKTPFGGMILDQLKRVSDRLGVPASKIAGLLCVNEATLVSYLNGQERMPSEIAGLWQRLAALPARR